MTEMYTCPVDGCDYSGVRRSVASHYSGKRDDKHSGGYEKANALLSDAEPTGTVTDTDKPDTGGSDTAESQAGGENPLSEGPGSTPTDGRSQTDETDSGDSGADGACCDNPDPMEIESGIRFQTKDGRTAVTSKGDRYCPNCAAVISSDGEVVR